jgi:hypothetical protein
MAARTRKPKAGAASAAPAVCNLCEGTGTVLKPSTGSNGPTSYACPQCRPATSANVEVKASLPPLPAVVPDDAVRMAEAVIEKWGATGGIRAFYVALRNFGLSNPPVSQIPDVAEARHVAAMRKVVPVA